MSEQQPEQVQGQTSLDDQLQDGGTTDGGTPEADGAQAEGNMADEAQGTAE